METFSWVVGSVSPVALQLMQADGTPADLTGVEVGVNYGGACHRIPATLSAGQWSFMPTGIPAGLRRAQVWWDAGNGMDTNSDAVFVLEIVEAC